MTAFVVREFSGIAPGRESRLLAPTQAEAAANGVLTSGSLRPLRANTAVLTLPKAGQILSIHRFGQDVAADNQYWFHWAADVNVQRGPVFADAQERTYFTGAGAPQVTDNSIALTGGTSYPMASYALGIPAPSTTPAVALSGTGTGIAETRLYAVTYVSGWGEEGCPCAATTPIDVHYGETVNLTGIPLPPGGAYNIVSKRIYRSVPGTLGTPYLLVAEIPAATTTYADSVLSADLGRELDSTTYTMPPAGLTGLVSLPNGVMAGFVGHDIYFSEPFKPHAWPLQYVLTVDYKIVGLAVFDATLLVLTTGKPYLVSGTDPANYSMVAADLPQACVSKRSIASVFGGVAYASPDGLFLVGGGQTRNLTAGLFSRREWQAINPATLHGVVVDNTYIGFYNGTAGFLLDLERGTFMPLDWYAAASFYDAQRDALFLVTGSNALVKFDAGAALTLLWRSKAFYSPRLLQLGRGRVEARAYPVTCRVYADGTLVHTQTVTDSYAFALPDEVAANVWQFEVSGTQEILSAGIAETAMDFAHG